MVKAFDRCLDLQHRAIDTLEGFLKAKSPHVRLKAAQLVTEMNWKYFVEKEASDKGFQLTKEEKERYIELYKEVTGKGAVFE